MKVIITDCDHDSIAIEQKVLADAGMELKLCQAVTEDEVIERIKRLKEQKVIRRIAGLFDSDKLGYVSVLCGMKVPAENIDALSDLLQQFSGITHNYLRHHEYNMWFTLISPSKEARDSVLHQIEDSGLANHIVKLYSEKKYKIRANFAVGDSR